METELYNRVSEEIFDREAKFIGLLNIEQLNPREISWDMVIWGSLLHDDDDDNVNDDMMTEKMMIPTTTIVIGFC